MYAIRSYYVKVHGQQGFLQSRHGEIGVLIEVEDDAHFLLLVPGFFLHQVFYSKFPNFQNRPFAVVQMPIVRNNFVSHTLYEVIRRRGRAAVGGAPAPRHGGRRPDARLHGGRDGGYGTHGRHGPSLSRSRPEAQR